MEMANLHQAKYDIVIKDQWDVEEDDEEDDE